MIKKCLNCGKEFDAKRDRIRFCSVACGASFSGKERWKDAWVIVECKRCNKKFKTKKLYPHYFCSVSCAAKARPCKPRTRQEGDVFKRPSDKYYMIKTDGKLMHYHRWLMEQKIGRKLSINEDVHHIDFDKFNNDINNLELLTHSEHMHKHQIKNNNLGNWVKEHGPTNKGKTGSIPWNKGKKTGPMSQEQKDLLRQRAIEARKKKFWSSKKKIE